MALQQVSLGQSVERDVQAETLRAEIPRTERPVAPKGRVGTENQSADPVVQPVLAPFALLEELRAEAVEQPEGFENGLVLGKPDQPVGTRLVHPGRDLAFAHIDAGTLDRREGA